MNTDRAGYRPKAEEPALRPAFVAGDEGEARWWGGGLAVLKATASDTGG